MSSLFQSSILRDPFFPLKGVPVPHGSLLHALQPCRRILLQRCQEIQCRSSSTVDNHLFIVCPIQPLAYTQFSHKWANPFSPLSTNNPFSTFANGKHPFVSSSTNGQTTVCVMSKQFNVRPPPTQLIYCRPHCINVYYNKHVIS